MVGSSEILLDSSCKIIVIRPAVVSFYVWRSSNNTIGRTSESVGGDAYKSVNLTFHICAVSLLSYAIRKEVERLKER